MSDPNWKLFFSGRGKSTRVAVFATGAAAVEATKLVCMLLAAHCISWTFYDVFLDAIKEEIACRMSLFARCRAGATIVGGEELVAQIKDGFLDFDRCVAL
jgi:ribosomal protein L1